MFKKKKEINTGRKNVFVLCFPSLPPIIKCSTVLNTNVQQRVGLAFKCYSRIAASQGLSRGQILAFDI